MAQTKQSSQLSVDYVISRKIYKFPGVVTGSRIVGSPLLIHEHSVRLRQGDSESYTPPTGVIISNANAYVLQFSTAAPPSLGIAYAHYQDIRATIQGRERKYIGCRTASGHVTPASTTALKDAIDTATNAAGGFLEFVAGFLSVDAELGVLNSQPLPNHDLGVIRIESSIQGVTAEGGSLTDNYSVLSNTDLRFTHDVYTEAMVDFIVGRQYWDEFLMLSSDQRKTAIRYVQERYGLAQRNPHPTPTVLPSRAGFYPYWALERNLDPYSPPRDVRTLSYPGYNRRTMTAVN